MRTAGVALSPSTETLAGSGVFQTGQRRAARRRTLAAGSSCAAALGDKINEPAGAWQSLSSPARGRGAGAPAGRCLVPDLPPRPTIPVSAVIYWRANVSQRFVNTGSGGLLWRRPWELSRAVSPALGLLLLETRARSCAPSAKVGPSEARGPCPLVRPGAGVDGFQGGQSDGLWGEAPGSSRRVPRGVPGGRRLGGCSAHSSGHPTPAVLGLRPPGGDSACAMLVEQCWAQGPGWAGAF